MSEGALAMENVLRMVKALRQSQRTLQWVEGVKGCQGLWLQMGVGWRGGTQDDWLTAVYAHVKSRRNLTITVCTCSYTLYTNFKSQLVKISQLYTTKYKADSVQSLEF